MYTTLKHSMLGVSLLCASLCAPLSSHAQVASGYSTNPLIAGSKLPFGAPDFRIIRGEHYLPAIKAGIAQQRAAIKEIVDNKKKPTFKNTVLAYEKSGELLDRVTSVFFGLTSAHKTSDIEAAEPEAIRLLTEFGNEVSFNQAFFDRVKYVYDNERSKLKGEDQKLLE